MNKNILQRKQKNIPTAELKHMAVHIFLTTLYILIACLTKSVWRFCCYFLYFCKTQFRTFKKCCLRPVWGDCPHTCGHVLEPFSHSKPLFVRTHIYSLQQFETDCTDRWFSQSFDSFSLCVLKNVPLLSSLPPPQTKDIPDPPTSNTHTHSSPTVKPHLQQQRRCVCVCVWDSDPPPEDSFRTEWRTRCIMGDDCEHVETCRTKLSANERPARLSEDKH